MENNNRTEEQLPEIKNYFENSVLFSTWSTIVLRLVVLVCIYIEIQIHAPCLGFAQVLHVAVPINLTLLKKIAKNTGYTQ